MNTSPILLIPQADADARRHMAEGPCPLHGPPTTGEASSALRALDGQRRGEGEVRALWRLAGCALADWP